MGARMRRADPHWRRQQAQLAITKRGRWGTWDGVACEIEMGLQLARARKQLAIQTSDEAKAKVGQNAVCLGRQPPTIDRIQILVRDAALTVGNAFRGL